MAITTEQENQLQTLYRVVIQGEEDNPSLRSQVNKTTRQPATVLSLLKGIAIGLLIGGVLMGYLSLKDEISFVK